MSLVDIFRRNDPRGHFAKNARLASVDLGGKTWSGLMLTPDRDPVFRIERVFELQPFRNFTLEPNWLINRNPTASLKRRIISRVREILSPATVAMELSYELPERPNFRSKAVSRIEVLRNAQTLQLPVPDFQVRPGERIDLVARLEGARGDSVFLGVYCNQSRKVLIDQAVGTGIEIGPGPKPQIMNSDQTKVSYLEEKHPAEWNSLYNDNKKFEVDAKKWEHYIYGLARKIPVKDESLDFIFSSHVFEHLNNPIGHLKHWHSKLRPGGKVLAVVPNIRGCKDINAEPSSFDQFAYEDRNEEWDAPLSKYEHYVRLRGMKDSPEDWCRQKRSIHVHFYNNENMTRLLKYACAELGYQSYWIHFEPNHKDFYFSLLK